MSNFNQFQQAFLRGARDAIQRQRAATPPVMKAPPQPGSIEWAIQQYNKEQFNLTNSLPTPPPLPGPRPADPRVYVPPPNMPAPAPGPAPRAVVGNAPPLPIERAVSAAIDAAQAAPGAVADVAQAIPGAATDIARAIPGVAAAIPGALGRGLSQPFDPLLGGIRRAVTSPGDIRDAAGAYPFTRAAGRVGESVADYFSDPGQIPGDLGKGLNLALDRVGKPAAGYLLYGATKFGYEFSGKFPEPIARILRLIPNGLMPGDMKGLINAYETGYAGEPPGPSAAELYFRNEIKNNLDPITGFAVDLLLDTVEDPVSYIGAGAHLGKGIATVAREAPDLARGVRAGGRVLGEVLQAPAAVTEALSSIPRAGLRGVGRVVEAVPPLDAAVRHLSERAPRQAFEDAADKYRRAINQLRGAELPPSGADWANAPRSPVPPVTTDPTLALPEPAIPLLGGPGQRGPFIGPRPQTDVSSLLAEPGRVEQQGADYLARNALPPRAATTPADADFIVNRLGDAAPTTGVAPTSPANFPPILTGERPPLALPSVSETIQLRRKTGGITVIGNPEDGVRVLRRQRNPDIWVVQEKNQRGWWEDRQGGLRTQADADRAGREFYRQKTTGASLTERPAQIPLTEAPPAQPASLVERPAPTPLTQPPPRVEIVPSKPEPPAPDIPKAPPKRPLQAPPSDAQRHVDAMVDVSPDAWSARAGDALYDPALNRRRYSMYSSLWLQKLPPGERFSGEYRALAEAGHERWLNLQARRVSRHGETVLEGLRGDRALKSHPEIIDEIARRADQLGTRGGSGAAAAYSTVIPGVPQLGQQLDRFAKYLRETTPGIPRAPLPTPISSTVGPLAEETLPFDARNLLTDETRATLDTAIPGGSPLMGKTLHEGFSETRTRVAAEQAEFKDLLQRSGLKRENVEQWTAKKLTERSPLTSAETTRLKNLSNTWRDYGDILDGNADDLATEYVSREGARAQTGYEGMGRLERGYRRVVVNPMRAILHDPVNWGYTLRNWISDESLVAIDSARRTGSPISVTGYNISNVSNAPRTSFQWYKDRLSAAIQKSPEKTRGYEALTQMETGGIRRQVQTSGFAGANLSTMTPQQSKLRRAWGMKGQYEQARETSSRIGYYGFLAETYSQAAVPELVAEASAFARRRGLDLIDEEITGAIDGIIASRQVETFAPREVYDALDELATAKGIGKADANALSTVGMKKWATLNEQVDKRAFADASRPLAIASERNVDRYLSLVVPFHIWQSRIMPYIAEEALRNPALVAGFLRARQGLEERADVGKYPGAVRGWLRVLTGPMGMNFYLNPSTFFIISQLADQTSMQDDESRTAWGDARAWVQENLGVGIYPAIDMVFNILGAYGDVPVRPPINLPTARLVIRALDAVRAETFGPLQGEGPHTPVFDNALQWVREQVTTNIIPASVPGSSPVYATDPQASYFDNLVSMIMQQNPDLPPEQAWQLAEDEDSPEFRAANKALARSGFLTQLWNSFSPAAGRARPIQRDADVATPPEFRTVEQQTRRGVATAGSPQSAELIGPMEQYNNPPGGQGFFRNRWNDLAYGDEAALRALNPNNTAPGVANMNGRYYSVEEVLAMTEDDRRALADGDAAMGGSLGLVQGQQEYQRAQRDASPALDDYKRWQGEVFNAGVEEWWRAEIQQNPNARRYYDQQRGKSPDDRRGALTGPQAFAASRGFQASVYDPAPLSTGTPLQNSSTGSVGFSYAQELASEQAEYGRQMAMVDLAVQQISQGSIASYFDVQNPMVKRVINAQLQQAGISVPEGSAGLRAYWAWSSAQAPGTDTSIPSFLAWRDQFLASMTPTQGLPSRLQPDLAVPA